MWCGRKSTGTGLKPTVLIRTQTFWTSAFSSENYLFSSVSQSCLTLCDPIYCSTTGFRIRHQLSELTQTHVHRAGDAIQPSHPLSSPSPPASIRVFSNESVFRISWPKYWSFSFSISPSNEYSRLISFSIDWFGLLAVQGFSLPLLAVQGTLKSLLQHHSSKALIHQCSTFFMVHLSHPYMTTVKTIALTRWTFVGKLMCLFFNRLSRFVIAFLPRSKCFFISLLQSPSAVILEPKKKRPRDW